MTGSAVRLDPPLWNFSLAVYGRDGVADECLDVQERFGVNHVLDILRGNINVDDVTIDSPVIQVVEYADGSRNIDRMVKAMSSGKSSSSAPAKPGHGLPWL